MGTEWIDYINNVGFAIVMVFVLVAYEWYNRKRNAYYYELLLNDNRKRINDLEERLDQLQYEYQEYLKGDNKALKDTLNRSTTVLKETTNTLDNAIEVIRLNTEAYEKSRIVFERITTYITETTKLISEWARKK